MIDDLTDIRVLNVVHSLRDLIVVHQNDRPFSHAQQVSAGDHPQVSPLLVQDREVAIPFLGHDLLNLFRIIRPVERGQIVFLHEMLDRHALVDEPGDRVGIQRRHDNRASALLRQRLYGPGDRRIQTDHDASGIHLDGAQLSLIAVAENDHVMLIDIVLHHIRVGGGDHDLALVKTGIFIAYDHPAVQRIQNIPVGCFGHGNNGAVVLIHVGFCDIIRRDQTCQAAVLIGNGQGKHILHAHQVPCPFDGNVLVDRSHFPDLHILDPGPDIDQIRRRLHLEVIQHKLGLRIDLAGPAGQIIKLRIGPVLQICI